MTYLEKLGLIIVLLFFYGTFPESWKGLEVFIFFLGCVLFLAGRENQTWR